MGGRGGAASKLPGEQCAIVGANIRALRQRRGWTQRKFGELMGWQSASTVCAAEGHRNRRQRSFATEEVEQLAAIFDVSPFAAHDAVRELRQPSASRVRLPGLRSRV